MRPINLIPPEEAAKHRRTLGDGAFGWAVIGVLILAVIGALVYATTSASVSSRESEVAQLEHQVADAEERADELAPYVEFQQTVEARQMTVASLAASRFDWERVMRELSLIIPDDIVIEALTASVSPEVTVPNSVSVAMRGESPGPALELSGCGLGSPGEAQDAVAGFIAALYGMDGVTRVGVPQSGLAGEGEGASDLDSTLRCAAGEVAVFQAVAAFDHAPVAGEEPDPPPTSTEPEGGEG